MAVALLEGKLALVPWDTTTETAATRAEALRRAVRSGRIEGLGDRAVTATFGVAPWATGEPLAATIGRAKAALDRAERAGGDRVVRYFETQAAPAHTA